MTPQLVMHTQDSTTVKPLAQYAGAFRRPPAGTLSLCLFTVGVFIGQTITGGGRWTQAVGAVPSSVFHISSITRISEGQVIPVWLTLFTYMFLHGGWWHVLSNMAGLWFFGAIIEPLVGTKRFVLGYLVCGITGAFAVAVVFPNSSEPAFGASLAICGILGAYSALRLPNMIRRRAQFALVLILETAAILFVGVWFSVRTVHGDREGSLMYHLLSFMAAWFSVRIWRGCRRLSLTHESRMRN